MVKKMYHGCQKKIFKLLKISDEEGHLLGITDPKKESKVFRLLVLLSIRMLVVSILIPSLIMVSPLGTKILNRYIMKNPSVVLESLQEMDKKERNKAQKDAKEAAKELAESIPLDSSSAIIGDKNAKNTIIEFFDYSCGYCKKEAVEIRSILKKRKDVRLVLQDYPVLSMSSLSAAKASMFVAKNYPSKMEAFHFALMEEGSVNDTTIKKIGEKVGISAKKMEQALSSDEFESQLREHYNRGTKIKATGTPVLIINGKLHIGYLTEQQILDTMSS